MGQTKSKELNDKEKENEISNEHDNSQKVKSFKDIQKENEERFLMEPPTPLILNRKWTSQHDNALIESLKCYQLNDDITDIIKQCIGTDNYKLTSITYDVDKSYIDSLKDNTKLKDKDDFKVFVSGSEGCGKTVLLDAICGKKGQTASNILQDIKKRIGFDSNGRSMMFMEEYSGDFFSTSDMMFEGRSRNQSDVILNLFVYNINKKNIPYNYNITNHQRECGVIVRNVFENEEDITDQKYYDKLIEICMKYHVPYIEINAKTRENLDIMIEQIIIQFMYYGTNEKQPYW